MTSSNYDNYKQYELFVKYVYEILNKNDGLQNVSIQHDVEIQGKVRSHQIDVYWEFSIAGVPFKIIVECKNYSRRITAEKIDAFRTVLEDIPGAKGIYATTVGYQEGALKDCEAYGILPMVIKYPTEEDLKGRITHITIDYIFQCLGNTRVQLILDGADYPDAIPSFPQGALDGDVYVEESGKEPVSLYQLKNKLPRDKEGKGLVYTYQYPKDTRIVCGDKSLKIRAIQYTYDVYHTKGRQEIDYKDIVKGIVKNVITGDTSLINLRGGVRNIPYDQGQEI